MNDIHVTPWCFWCDTGFTSNRDYQLHWEKVHLSKESIMNDQMEQVWRSKDGKCVGSKEEVEAYLATLSPLGKMQFPYRAVGGDLYPEESSWERTALVAFANLAPLIQEVMDAWNANFGPTGWRREKELFPTSGEMQALLLAYEEALKLVPR